jgi:UDP-N-acetylmuramoyl-L-alanyl-D-glutamate--2,6-diaminopimelate ligase
VEAGPAGSQIELEANLKGKTEHYQINTSLPGQFNVYNALAAACVGEVIGLSTEEIVKGIGSLESVAGRMNTIDEGQDFGVIVDFAHTPDSFEKLLPEVKKITKGRLICVFGSAGRRDKTKRAVQGELAGKFSDVVVVTEEDDRDENGQAILEEIASGAEKAGKQKDKDLYLIHDRTQAIEWAINNAEAGDIVLLLGKGHEATIERADGEHPWNESEVARQAIRSRLKTKS